MSEPVLVELAGIRIQLPSQSPVLLLRETGGSTHIPIWIGPVEAASIAAALEGVEPQRPMTHDLLVKLITTLDAGLSRVTITDVEQSVFFAELALETVLGEKTISCRPSDAVAVAARLDTPLFVAQSVLDSAGIQLQEESDESAIEEFKEFLEDVSPEDFTPGE
jgi:bifunctional DNase/RNase